MSAEDLFAGRYRLLDPLGRGAMSSVWLAEDEELERRVAVKMLAAAADPARFEREARAAAMLSHPNIVALYDYGEAGDGRRYMVLEYLTAGSLEDRLREGPFSDNETQRIARDVAAGLAHAHERGLVHRDLKPANVLFDSDGNAKIADFGIARLNDSTALTEVGTVLGTASTISPEQAAGAPAGPASDVYSFGVVLFRMLTGAAPFASDNAMELVRMHRDEPAPTVASIRPDAPPRLASLADAALRKDPEARPADGAALLAALGGAAAGDATIATTVLPPARRRRNATPAIVAAGVVALLAAGGLLAYALTRDDSNDTPTTVPSLTLPSVPTTTAPPTTAPATTAASATTPTTTAPTTTVPTTTATTTTVSTPTTRPTTTAPTTTAPTATVATTTAPVTTAPTTTAPDTTTVETTTAAVTP